MAEGLVPILLIWMEKRVKAIETLLVITRNRNIKLPATKMKFLKF